MQNKGEKTKHWKFDENVSFGVEVILRFTNSKDNWKILSM